MASVDIACSFFVLEHDEHPETALEYLWSVLKPGGLLYLMLPSYMTNLGDLACADHVNHFSRRSLSRLVAECGFDVLVVDDESAVGGLALLARRMRRPGAIDEMAREEVRAEATQAGAAFVEYLSRLKALVASLDPGRPIYLYGAGFYAALTAALLGDGGREASGVFDANPRKQGAMRLGRRVAAPEEALTGRHRDAVLLVCVNTRVAGTIVDRFRPVFQSVLVP